jgi:hypothetical protein
MNRIRRTWARRTVAEYRSMEPARYGEIADRTAAEVLVPRFQQRGILVRDGVQVARGLNPVG